jgi:hypothetical protein
MHVVAGLVQPLAQDRRPALDVGRADVGEVAIVLLRLDDRIEIAAIGDVDHQRSQIRALDLDLGGVEVGGDVADSHRVDIGPVTGIGRRHHPGRRVELQRPLLARADQPALQRHRHRADGAVAAHRQAAAGFDEDDAGVAIVASRGVEDAARHHVVAARLEHEPRADPVIVAHETLPPLAGIGGGQHRPAASDHPDRVAAGMGVDAEEGVAGHAGSGRARAAGI